MVPLMDDSFLGDQWSISEYKKRIIKFFVKDLPCSAMTFDGNIHIR